MNSAVSPASLKFRDDFGAHFGDRIGDGAEAGDFLREPAHQPEVAAPALDAMTGSALDEPPSSLGKRASRGLVRYLIVFSIGVGATLAWQWYADAARIATALPPETASVPQPAPEQTPAVPQPAGSPELQQLKDDLAQLKQDLQQIKDIPAALATLRQSVDRLAASQQQIAGTIAKLSTQKAASPPRPAPAPAPKPLTPAQ